MALTWRWKRHPFTCLPPDGCNASIQKAVQRFSDPFIDLVMVFVADHVRHACQSRWNSLLLWKRGILAGQRKKASVVEEKDR